MNVGWNGEVVDQVESHWRHRLRPRLDGLTDDEYFWQPVPGCWTVSRRGTSSAPKSFGGGEFTWDYGGPHEAEPVTTIAWRLAHLTVCLGETNGTTSAVRRQTLRPSTMRAPRRRRSVSSTTLMATGSRVCAASAMWGLPGPKVRRRRLSSPMRSWRGLSCTRAWRSFTTVPRSVCCETSISGIARSHAVERPRRTSSNRRS